MRGRFRTLVAHESVQTPNHSATITPVSCSGRIIPINVWASTAMVPQSGLFDKILSSTAFFVSSGQIKFPPKKLDGIEVDESKTQMSSFLCF